MKNVLVLLMMLVSLQVYAGTGMDEQGKCYRLECRWKYFNNSVNLQGFDALESR